MVCFTLISYGTTKETKKRNAMINDYDEGKHLTNDSGNLLSLPAFQTKYSLKVRPLVYYGLISAVKLLKRHIPRNTTRPPLKYEGFLTKFVTNSKPSRLV